MTKTNSRPQIGIRGHFNDPLRQLADFESGLSAECPVLGNLGEIQQDQLMVALHLWRNDVPVNVNDFERW